MVIANIVSKKELSTPDYINLINNYSDRIKDLPTLIVGWGFVKEIFGEENVDILNTTISKEDNIYWCFSKFERRDSFEKDIEIFYNWSVELLDKRVKYVYFSVITNTLKRIKDFIKYINNKKDKIIYVYDNRMVYIYENKNIIGLSLDEIEFLGIKKEKIIEFLYKNKDFNHNCEITDILLENKDLVEKLKLNVKLIPLIYCG